ncbi:response regulator transcription factor [Paenibacillus guangzhouensis]|uniref:response regulator transcription factor n=1 Tax=Paenibacillus guangzhouensis TaxID=1473112 RepID=UPI001266DE02|nr:helix-turn-helix domain-containing protein [Paenibacillus guangzhouensis]
MDRYSVFIVDDESWVVESLKVSVDWQQYGFEVVGEAYNGLEALQCMRDLKPDVVFTDIRMPGMNGLELIKKGSELPVLPKFVVVSGYAEFAYAQRALNYGATAYCLKPYDDEEIANLLKKLRKTLNMERDRSETLIQLLADNNEDSLEKIKLALESRGLHMDRGQAAGLMVCTCEGDPFVHLDVIRIRIGKSKMLYMMAHDQLEAVLSELETQLPEGVRGIGVSGIIDDYAILSKELEHATLLSNQYFMTGHAGVYRWNPASRGVLKETFKKIGAAIANQDYTALGQLSDEVSGLLQQEGYTIKDALRLYNVTLSFLYILDEDQQEQMVMGYEQLMDTFENVSEMNVYLRSLSMKLSRRKPEYETKETTNETFMSILQYVHENYRSTITIQSLTQKYYINPNYLSQLFKKEVGETFTSYMTRLRINNACNLLEQTNLRVTEIAEKVGYQDYFYFTRMFKKITGHTPTQFREHMAK